MSLRKERYLRTMHLLQTFGYTIVAVLLLLTLQLVWSTNGESISAEELTTISSYVMTALIVNLSVMVITQ